MSKNLRWLGAFYALYFGYVGLHSPFLGPYLVSLGHSLTTVAWTVGMMQFMRIIGPHAWSVLADKTGQRVRWLRWGSLLGLCALALFFSFSEHALWVILLAVAFNSALSGQVPISDAYAFQVTQNQTGLYGRVRLWGSIGFIVAVVGFGQWSARFGLSAFPWMVLSAVLAVCWTTWRLQDMPVQAREHADEPMPSVRILFDSVPMRLFWACSFCMVAAHGGFYGFYSLYLQHHGYGHDQIGYLWAVGVIVEVFFFWYQGRFFDRFRLDGWLLWVVTLAVLRFALIAALPQNGWVMLLAQCLHAATFAAHHTAALTWLRLHCPPRLQVRGQGIYTGVAYGLGGSMGTALSGWAWKAFEPSGVFWVSTAFASLGAVFALALFWLDPLSSARKAGDAPLQVEPDQ